MPLGFMQGQVVWRVGFHRTAVVQEFSFEGIRNVTATGNIRGWGLAYLALTAAVSRSISAGISFSRF